MDQSIIYGILVVIFAVGVALIRVFLKDGKVFRLLQALPAILDTIGALISRADDIHDDLLVEYAEQAEATGYDVRLLWVIDQIEAHAKKSYGITLDINWIITQVEYLVKRKD